MGLFKRKETYVRNVENDNSFLKDFAIKVNGLMAYTKEHPAVTEELRKLKEDAQFTNASAQKSARKNEDKVEKLYEELKALLRQPDMNEANAILLIRDIAVEINEINAKK